MKKRFKIIFIFSILLLLLSVGINFQQQDVVADVGTSMEQFYDFQNEIKQLTMNDSVDNVVDAEVDSVKNNYKVEDNIFKLKRLIVKGNIKNNYGAERVISGYRDYHILCYSSEDKTEDAYYSFLKNDEHLSVSVDRVINASAYYNQTYTYDTVNHWGPAVIDAGGYNQYLLDNDKGQENVVVVIDTGINTAHEMFEDRFLYENGKIVGASYETTTYTYSGYDFEDDNGHGTHVAGIVCNLTPTNVKILPIKVMNKNGGGSLTDILAGVALVEQVYSVKYNIACINLSIGGLQSPERYAIEEDLFLSLRENRNILTVVAAGNDSIDASLDSLCADSAIVVSALTNRDNEAKFDSNYSNYGDLVDIAAPGTNVLAAYIGNSGTTASPDVYKKLQGTSMAAPQVAGAVALLCLDHKYYDGAFPSYSVDEIESKLFELAIDLGDPGKDIYYGHGALNLRYFETDLLETETITIKDINANKQIPLNGELYEYSDVLNIEATCSNPNLQVYYGINTLIPKNPVENLCLSDIDFTEDFEIYVVGYGEILGKIYRTNIYRFIIHNKTKPTEEYFEINAQGYITKYTGQFKELTVPEVVNGISVIGIDNYVFKGSRLVSITMPSVKNIFSSVFSDCKDLKYVYAPLVQQLTSSIFINCPSITYVGNEEPKGKTEGLFFPNLIYLGIYNFGNCENLKKAYFPNVTSGGYSCFENCISLEECYVPKLKLIEYAMFYFCSNLKSFEIGKDVENIEDFALYGTNLSSITVASGNKYYYSDGHGLYRDNQLIYYAVPESGVVNIKSQVIINGYTKAITEIGDLAFIHKSIKSLTLPASIKVVGKNAFMESHIEDFHYKATNLSSEGYYIYDEEKDKWSNYALFIGTTINNLHLHSGAKLAQLFFQADDAENVYLYSTNVSFESGNNFRTIEKNIYFNFAGADNKTFLTNLSGCLFFIGAQNIYSKSEIVNNKNILQTYRTYYSLGLQDNGYYCYSQYASETYSIVATCGKNGTISPIGTTTYNKGDVVHYDFIPDEGYILQSVEIHFYNGYSKTLTEDEIIAARACGYTFEQQGVSIHAEFVLENYTITVEKDIGVEINHNAIEMVKYGKSIHYMFYESDGCAIESIEIDGVQLTVEELKEILLNGYAFNNVIANHTIIIKSLRNFHIITASTNIGGTISPVGEKKVEDGQSVVFNITAYENYVLDYLLVDGERVEATNTYTFNNVVSDHTIVAVFRPEFVFITTYVNYGGTISPDGRVSVKYGEDISFAIEPIEGYLIKQVLVDGNTVVIDNNSYTFTDVTEDHTINVEFEIEKFDIIIAYGQGGTVTPSGTQEVAYNGSLTCVITSGYGYEIDKVIVDDIEVKIENNSYTFNNVKENHTFEVTFKKIRFKVFAEAINGGEISPSGEQMLEHGSSITFTITPYEGFTFKHLLVNGKEVFLNNQLFKIPSVLQNYEIVAVFEINKYTLNVSATFGGSVSPEGKVIVEHGDSLELTIAPDKGYELKSIFADGKDIFVEGNIFVLENITKSQQVVVTFKKIKYTITSSSSEGGQITPQGINYVEYNNSIAFMFTSDIGYTVAEVLVDNVPLNNANSGYTFLNVDDNHSIFVKYEKIKYNIDIVIEGKGQIELINGANPAVFGSDVKYKVIPNRGWRISTVYINGTQTVLNDNILELIEVESELLVEIFFTENNYSFVWIILVITTLIGGVVVAYILIKKQNKKKLNSKDTFKKLMGDYSQNLDNEIINDSEKDASVKINDNNVTNSSINKPMSVAEQKMKIDKIISQAINSQTPPKKVPPKIPQKPNIKK